MTQLREIETADRGIAKEYDDLISYYWQLQDSALSHSDLMLNFVKQRNKINLTVENLRQKEYRTLLQCKKLTFANIYDGIDKESRNILTAKNNEDVLWN